MRLRRNLRHARLRSRRGSHCEPGAQLLEQRLGLSASDRPRPSSEKPRVDTNAVEAVHKGVDARGNQPSLETLLPKPALLPVDLAEQRLTHLQTPAPRIVIENADTEESMGGR